MACVFDTDCPQTQWCYKYFGNSTPAFCDCPSYYGFIDKASNCTSFSVQTFLWIVPTCINSFVVLVLLGHYLWHAELHKALFVWPWVKISPAIKIWTSGLIAYVCMLVSFGIRLWDIFHPEGWDVVKSIRRDMFREREDLKVSEYLDVYFLFFMGYVLFFVIAIIETGVLWLELTHSAKNFAAARFRRVRLSALIFELFVTVLVVLSFAFSEFASLALFGWLGIPVVLGLLAFIYYGRIMILRLVQPSIARIEAEEVGGRRASLVTATKFKDFAERVREVSTTMLLALGLDLIPFTLMWVGAATDWRKVRPGELGYFVFALQLFDIIFILSASRVFNYTAEAVRAIGRRRSTRSGGSKGSKGSLPKQKWGKKRRADETYHFNSELESPSFNRWKRKLDEEGKEEEEEEEEEGSVQESITQTNVSL